MYLPEVRPASLAEETLQEVHQTYEPQELQRKMQPDFNPHVDGGRVRCFVVCVDAICGKILRCLSRRCNNTASTPRTSLPPQRRQDRIRHAFRRLTGVSQGPAFLQMLEVVRMIFNIATHHCQPPWSKTAAGGWVESAAITGVHRSHLLSQC